MIQLRRCTHQQTPSFKIKQEPKVIRNTLLVLVLVPSTSATAQKITLAAPPEGSSWQHVQALPTGASINVRARTGHEACNLKSVDADTLTCAHRKGPTF